MKSKCKLDSLGVMLDCSRNAVMSVSKLKEFVKILGDFGYNRIYVYLEDTYEIDGEEFFGYFRGRYNKNELKELDKYAFAHGIEVIPCIQTLAHLPGLVRWPEYSKFMDAGNMLLVDDEKTYMLIEKMINTMRECFRTDKIHIGMDEAYNLGKGKYRDLHGDVDRTQLFISHLNKVCQRCDKYGFKPLIWSDMLYRIASGDEDENAFKFDENVKSKIPKDVSLVYWDYFHVDRAFHDNMLKKHKCISDKIIYAGGAWKWASFVPNNSLAMESNRAAIDACFENGVRDVFVTLWGDNGSECSPFATLPALAYIAGIAYGTVDAVKMKFKSVTDCDFDDFLILESPDRYKDVPCSYVINPSKYQLYNDCFLGMYDSGVYEGDGKYYGELSKQLYAASKRNEKFSYIFDTCANLCSVLELKSEIGIETRSVYKNSNTEDLKVLIQRYELMIERTKIFYNSFRTQWFIENKANGFEIHDIRIGGLIMRMQNCHDRLIDFLNKTIDSIPELEEEVIPVIQKKELVWRWNEIVSANFL